MRRSAFCAKVPARPNTVESRALGHEVLGPGIFVERDGGPLMSFGNRRREKDIQREERRVQRVQREDAAGKLIERAPDLTSLSISIRETRPEGCVSDTQYTRRVVVASAPALFEVPCAYPDCEDGGYDVTREILLALASHLESFEGEQSCRGRCGSLECTRVLRYAGTATYKEGRPATPAPFSRHAMSGR